MFDVFSLKRSYLDTTSPRVEHICCSGTLILFVLDKMYTYFKHIEPENMNKFIKLFDTVVFESAHPQFYVS